MAIRQLRDVVRSIEERLSTFDGPLTLSEQVLFESKDQSKQIDSILAHIAAHLEEITFNRYGVKCFVAYFKISQDYKLTLLFINHLEVFLKDLKAELKVCGDRVDVLTNPKRGDSREKNGNGQSSPSKCLDCIQPCPVDNLCPVKYKYIVLRFNKERDSKEEKPNTVMTVKKNSVGVIFEEQVFIRNANQCIPTALKILYPKMKHKDYVELIKKDNFMSQNVLVCSECFQGYVKYFGDLGGNTVMPRATSPHRGLVYRGRSLPSRIKIVKEPSSHEQISESMFDMLSETKRVPGVQIRKPRPQFIFRSRSTLRKRSGQEYHEFDSQESKRTMSLGPQKVFLNMDVSTDSSSLAAWTASITSSGKMPLLARIQKLRNANRQAVELSDVKPPPWATKTTSESKGFFIKKQSKV